MQSELHHLCPNCHLDFNSTDRLPRIFLQCYSTICSACLSSHVHNDNIICPLHGHGVSSQGQGLKALPLNQALVELLAVQKSFPTCKEHQEPLRLVCLDDRSYICDDCVHEGVHGGHRAKPVKKLNVEASNKILSIENALKVCNEHKRNVLDVMDEKRGALLKVVKEEFQSLRWLLMVKEQELSLEVNEFFDGQKDNIKDGFDSERSLTSSLNEKIYALKDQSNVDSFLDALEEDVELVLAQADIITFTNQVEKLRKGLEESLEDFRTSLVTNVQPFIVLLEFPSEEISNRIEGVGLGSSLVDQLNEGFFAENKESESTGLEDLDKYEVQPRKIIRSEVKSVCIDKTYIKDLRKLGRSINNQGRQDFDEIFYPNLLEKAQQDLKNYWSTLRDAKALEVDMKNQIISDSELFDCSLFTNWAKKDLDKIELSLKNSNFSEHGVIPLLGEILPRIRALKEIVLDLSASKISDKSIMGFARSMPAAFTELDKIELEFGLTGITDESVIQLMSGVCGVGSVSVGLSSTQISDCSFLGLALGISEYSKVGNMEKFQLECLKMDCSSTRVSNEGLIQLCESFKMSPLSARIISLNLNLSRTCVGDRGIEALKLCVLQSLTGLRNLELNFNYTNVSFEALAELFVALNIDKHIIKAKLTKSGIQATLKGFRNINDNLDYKLEGLELDLSDSIVKEVAISGVIESLGVVKRLSLNLSKVPVNSNMIIKVLSGGTLSLSGKDLENLFINLEGTKTTDEDVKTLVKGLKDSILKSLILDFSSTEISDSSMQALREVISGLKELRKLEVKIENNVMVSEYEQYEMIGLQKNYNNFI